MQSANVWIPVTTAVMTAVLSGAILLLLQWLVTPRIELNKTIQQEQWKTKRDAFLKAIELIDRQLESTRWRGPDMKDYVPDYSKAPTQDEKNEQLRLLLLLSHNPQIWRMFVDVFDKGISPTVRATYISLLREELFGSTAKIDPDQVPYFLHPPPDQLRAATEAIENSSTRQPGQA